LEVDGGEVKIPRFLVLIFAALMLAAGTAFVACNDDDDNGDATPTPVIDNGNGDDNGNGNGVIGDSDLERAANQFLNSTFRIVYTTRGEFFGDVGEDAEFVMYKDGTDRFRFDITGEEDGESVALIVIQTADASYMCFEGAGELGEFFGNGEGVCFSDEPDDINPFEDLVQELRDFADDYEVLGTSSRNIAGRNADCFELREIETGDEQEICFSDGLLLYFEDRTDGTTFEATDISTSVRDSDFDPPFPVEEFPGFDFDDDF
jgi:hypothetical protein